MSDKEIYLIGHREREFRLNLRKQYHLDEYIKPIDFVKIGISQDPSKRISNMDTSTPHELELITTIEAESPTTVESRLHSIYHAWKHNGEWFYLPNEEVDALRRIEWLNDDEIETVYNHYINNSYEPDKTVYDYLMEVRD